MEAQLGRVGKILRSSKLAMTILFVFIVVIATATFIEEKYDTATAFILIYDALWFELLMVILGVLYFFNISARGLFSKSNVQRQLFHISFIILIIGGGITRYFGYEANMHILEKEAVNTIYTSEPYIQLNIPGKDLEYSTKSPQYFSQVGKNAFHEKLEIAQGEHLIISYKDYRFYSQIDKPAYINEIDPDELILNINYKGEDHEAVIYYDREKYIQPFQEFNFDDLQLELTYGPKPLDLPFTIQLEEFTLSRYPGSNFPSASVSKVILIDERKDYKRNHIIAKNKVLNYGGYRFFQTSYDEDENGTILSLNYDYFGTRITYLGYLLMSLGALIILLSKKSEFSKLDIRIKEIREKRKSLFMGLVLLLGLTGTGFAQIPIQNPISREHADDFGQLLVQTYDGRYTSVHSLATDVIHKLSGEDKIYTIAKGKMDAVQAFLDMLVDPDYWKDQPIIVIRNQALRDMLDVENKHASFNDFIGNNLRYKLEQENEIAYKKKASEQSSLDREILRVTERVGILNMTLTGSLLQIFPEPDSKNNNWISWTDPLAVKPLLNQELLFINEDLKLADFNYQNIMRSYLISTINSRQNNDYAVSNRITAYIKGIQRQIGTNEYLPSDNKVKFEILYNNSRIFEYSKLLYGILGLLLLVFALIENFKKRPDKKIRIIINILTGLIALTFVYQSLGLALRWYVSGHAPMSNGYEVLLLVAWSGILAGFSAIKYSKITLGSTSLLAFLVLMTAGHSYYDPQLTNLEPVLQSFWLIIHVTIITIGFGFLALGFVLGILNMIIAILKKQGEKSLSYYLIEELTCINKRLITIGMFLSAVGTFIGCIWANETWGTYWAWNAKQTWSLIIVLAYGLILHFRLMPKMKSDLIFNIGSIIAFGSVIMTFIGVNYYFTKGLHSYASDDPPIFPLWAWITIISIMILIIASFVKSRYTSEQTAIESEGNVTNYKDFK